MKKLIDIFQKIDNILLLLDETMHEEYKNLLNPHTDMKKLFAIIEKKQNLLHKLTDAKKIRISLEQSYNIFPPYLKFNKLNHYSNQIINKCILLNKINLKNKKLTKNKFYLNQNFLNVYKSYNNSIYNIHGNLDN
ncbi:flagellar biosynthesis protein FlgN [Buchnera aphidicola (Aphis fabae)]|uniref:Flagellar biosynthesis protein FlgN n=1 Tax=Buchnera aphidicola (Aphis fabae) TaxID=571430 RepID=A0A5J6ZF95_9GAMM|nr:flagellar export chaperone FlgN [Buchnera aphidicola]QFQ32506.1 flagellar biosynthesis protein FlgN [Buchnera aphidicola (Aphis fabae)]